MPTCPDCDRPFKDGRGFTAHQRAYHQPEPPNVRQAWAVLTEATLATRAQVGVGWSRHVAYDLFVESLARVTAREN